MERQRGVAGFSQMPGADVQPHSRHGEYRQPSEGHCDVSNKCTLLFAMAEDMPDLLLLQPLLL